MIITGDCLSVLPAIEERSIQCCVTSPPYYGLRDYGTGKWIDGDESCCHSVGCQVADTKWEGAITTGQRPGVDASKCRRCGARRVDLQIGLEPTPDEYVSKLVDVFREVHRVLKDDGTLWLNLGDSYATSPGTNNQNLAAWSAENARGGGHRAGDLDTPIRSVPKHLKPKDIIGIPWRVAFALQADGWYLRSDIIWHKPNPMPESVKDRPTRSHEYLFLLSKSQRYYYDSDAIKEPVKASTVSRLAQEVESQIGSLRANGGRKTNGNMKAVGTADVRNARSVWTITTKPFRGAHFATFPEALVEPCIKAGSRPGDTILDPFFGAGTVGVVARNLGRNYVGIELNPEYCEIAKGRINKARDKYPLFQILAEKESA